MVRKTLITGAFLTLSITLGVLSPLGVKAHESSIEGPLFLGVRNNEVSSLQSFLRDKGYFKYPEITNYFGLITAGALTQFQRDNNLEPVGFVGPLTRKLINDILVMTPHHEEVSSDDSGDAVGVIETNASSGNLSVAMGKWSPTRSGECTKEQHDAYSATGPDGKQYPTWHPPVHPSGCTFGHEHGSNPAESSLNSLGPILFGYVSEQMSHAEGGHRHEDHVGHKVEFANSVTFKPSQIQKGASVDQLTCDVLAKLHQGTHSEDAFTNNLHEQIARVRCTDGTFFNVQLMSAIGPGGQMSRQCSPQEKIEVGSATPGDSPRISNPLNPGRSLGNRFIPDSRCVDVARPNTFENWKTQNTITAPDMTTGVRFAFYWSVSNPSRYLDTTKHKNLGRTVDTCFANTGGVFRAISNPCLSLQKLTNGVPIAWDDPRSPFTGTKRGLRLNDFSVQHSEGPTVWYTDALGMNPSARPFTGSIKQEVSNKSHQARFFVGPSVSRDHSATGVRAPN
jgi:hypothetical protein